MTKSTDLAIATQTRLPTAHGDFVIVGFTDFVDGAEHVALVRGDVRGAKDVLTRIHSECLTGDVFGSKRCDCGDQLSMAMQKIVDNGSGVILYLRQEGRGIGLGNKLRAYALQEQGMDTVEANRALGFADDARSFAPAVHMLQALGVESVHLLTNNPRKVSALEDRGMIVTQRIPLLSCTGVDSAAYMQTKADKLGHILPQVKKTA
jgi:GTP cyclohydrolase II